MPLDDEQKLTLSTIGSELLDTLQGVAEVARVKLNRTPSHPSTQVFALGNNPMVGSSSAERTIAAIHSQAQEHLMRLEREPFVARLLVRWEDEKPPREETLYISRASVVDLASELSNIKLASYRAPLGRLAEFKVGEDTTVVVDRREREVTIRERVTLRPEFSSGQWDAVDDVFAFEEWNANVESVRRFLEQIGRAPVPFEEDIPDVLGVLLGSIEEATLIAEGVFMKTNFFFFYLIFCLHSFLL